MNKCVNRSTQMFCKTNQDSRKDYTRWSTLRMFVQSFLFLNCPAAFLLMSIMCSLQQHHFFTNCDFFNSIEYSCGWAPSSETKRIISFTERGYFDKSSHLRRGLLMGHVPFVCEKHPISIITQHVLVWDHNVMVHISLFGDCVDSVLMAHSLAEALTLSNVSFLWFII